MGTTIVDLCTELKIKNGRMKYLKVDYEITDKSFQLILAIKIEMEMINNEDKLSLNECLTFMEKLFDIGDLRYLREYILRMYNEKCIGGLEGRLIMIAQISFLMNGIYDGDNNFLSYKWLSSI